MWGDEDDILFPDVETETIVCNHIPFIDKVYQAVNGVPMHMEIKCVKCGQICVTKFRD